MNLYNHERSVFLAVFITLLNLSFSGLHAQQLNVDAFESSRFIDPRKFAEPPKGYRQHAWLTYNLSRSTEESLSGQIRLWAEQDLTGGFYLDPKASLGQGC